MTVQIERSAQLIERAGHAWMPMSACDTDCIDRDVATGGPDSRRLSGAVHGDAADQLPPRLRPHAPAVSRWCAPRIRPIAAGMFRCEVARRRLQPRRRRAARGRACGMARRARDLGGAAGDVRRPSRPDRLARSRRPRPDDADHPDRPRRSACPARGGRAGGAAAGFGSRRSRCSPRARPCAVAASAACGPRCSRPRWTRRCPSSPWGCATSVSTASPRPFPALSVTRPCSQSIRRLLRTRSVVAQVVLAAPEPPGTDRRDLAVRSERAARLAPGSTSPAELRHFARRVEPPAAALAI